MATGGPLKKLDENVAEIDVMGELQSLDDLMADGENRWADFVVDNARDLAEALAKKEWKKKAQEILARLTPRERRIVYLRFWEDKVLEEIGEDLNLSRERIRQVLNAVLQELRDDPELEDFEDID